MPPELPDLTPAQYWLVYYGLIVTTVTFFSAFVYFVYAQKRVSSTYSIPLFLGAAVVFIAGYHHLTLLQGWEAAFASSGNMFAFQGGDPLNELHRYIHWFLTVPLLVVQLVLVTTSKGQARGRLAAKLGIAAALMIVLGYPGASSDGAGVLGARGFWGLASMVPFLYILYVLYGELSYAIDDQSAAVATAITRARFILVVTWSVYPIMYLFPLLGGESAAVLVMVQVGYALADVLAKAVYGAYVYRIARTKTLEAASTSTKPASATP